MWRNQSSVHRFSLLIMYISFFGVKKKSIPCLFLPVWPESRIEKVENYYDCDEEEPSIYQPRLCLLLLFLLLLFCRWRKKNEMTYGHSQMLFFLFSTVGDEEEQQEQEEVYPYGLYLSHSLSLLLWLLFVERERRKDRTRGIKKKRRKGVPSNISHRSFCIIFCFFAWFVFGFT